MRDLKIVVSPYGDAIITLARYGPLETTIIATKIDDTFQPIATLKNKATNVVGATASTPPVAPPVKFF